MWRLRLRLKAAHQKFPGMGYMVAMFFCLALVALGALPWEWGLFVLWPGLNGVCYVIAPRKVWGGKLYWALAGAWFGAAALGVLAHWGLLEPYTPWFSLGRYGLFAGAYLAGMAAPLTGRPDFSSREEPKLKRLSAKVMLVLILLGHVAQVAFIVYLTPFRLAMAPRYPGLTVRKVWALREDEYPTHLAWNPDSRYLLMDDEDGGVWLITPEQKRAKRIAEGYRVSRQPWLASGDGFVAVPQGEGESGAHILSPDGHVRRRILGGQRIFAALASPVEDRIALSVSEKGIWTADADGSDLKILMQDGWVGLTGQWSPDGRLLLFERRPKRKGERHLTLAADLNGSVSEIGGEFLFPDQITWASRQSVAVIEGEESAPYREEPWWSLGWLLKPVTMSLLDLEGRRVGGFTTRVPLGGIMPSVAGAPGGDALAFCPCVLAPIPNSLGWLFVLDMGNSKVWRLPGGFEDTSAMTWSSDERSLALVGTPVKWHVSGDGGAVEWEKGVWVISGFQDEETR